LILGRAAKLACIAVSALTFLLAQNSAAEAATDLGGGHPPTPPKPIVAAQQFDTSDPHHWRGVLRTRIAHGAKPKRYQPPRVKPPVVPSPQPGSGTP